MIISTNKYADLPIFITKNLFTNDINLLKKSTAIHSSVKNLILTLTGERRFNFDIGTLVYSGLFVNQNDTLIQTEFLNSVLITLSKYEPRITDVTGDINIIDNVLKLDITYKLINSSEIQTLSVAI